MLRPFRSARHCPSAYIILPISLKSAPVGKVVNELTMFVLVPPGATAFTRTPLFAVFVAKALVSCTTPPLLAQYAALHGRPCMPGIRGGVDDDAVPLLQQVGQGVPTDIEGAVEIDAHNAVEVLLGVSSWLQAKWPIPAILQTMSSPPSRPQQRFDGLQRQRHRPRRRHSDIAVPPAADDRRRRSRQRRAGRHRQRAAPFGGKQLGSGSTDARPLPVTKANLSVNRFMISPPKVARRSFLSTLPLGLRGSISTISSCSGILCIDSCCALEKCHHLAQV